MLWNPFDSVEKKTVSLKVILSWNIYGIFVVYVSCIKTVMWLLQPPHPYLLLPPAAEMLDALPGLLSFALSSMRTKGNTKPEEAIGEKNLHSDYTLPQVRV